MAEFRFTRRAGITRWIGWAGAAFLMARSHAQGAEPVEIAIAGMQFLPARLEIRAGMTVRWVNREKRTSHSVLFADQPESPRLLPDESWERRFDQPGDYPYQCGPHPEMRGLVVVR